MAVIELNVKAPDFTLTDVQGKEITLSNFIGSKHIILVLNRGFV
ncbi:MAG: redoxin domain-containing protein [Anaerolineaceae bacterium]|nr:redoxin domain-containing protein [Anaerolineaceae bacterium]